MATMGVSYFGNRMIQHVERDLKELKAKGFTDILHTVSENDLKFYRGTMEEIIQLSKEIGFTVTVSPWSIGLVFGGEAFSEFHIHHPEACQVTQGGKRLPQACFNHPVFRGFMKKWADAVSGMGADYILWDEPHWAGQGGWYFIGQNEWTCRCEACRDSFIKAFGCDMPAEWNEDIEQFRKDVMIDFLDELSKYALGRGVKNIVCFFPNREKLIVPPEWEKAAGLEAVEIFATDPYWAGSKFAAEEFVDFYVKAAMDIAGRTGTKPQLYIQNFRIPGGKESDICSAVEIGWKNGIRDFYTWGFNSCAHMSFLRSDHPEKAFKAYYETVLRKVGCSMA